MTNTAAPRVLIADDHPVYRDGLRMLLESTGSVEVVGTVADGDAALDAVVDMRPDVVVMDLQMPGTDGVEAVRRIVTRVPGTGVLVLSMHDDEENVVAAVLAGARGYLVKGADQNGILRAITAVAAGEVIFGPGVADTVARQFGHLAGRRLHTQPFPQLTARERDVLELVAAGLSNGQIAQRLVLSSKTVRNNVSTVLSKLQVADRAQAIVLARQTGLGESGLRSHLGIGPGGPRRDGR
ncbi:response regulator transcription factor [Pseudonocardia sp. N23]|uniref:response regulator n=1 Tax=Pseudonocardia sp. N23 TaxID=1987376 RepID=UPI000BFB9048|nr:response regulator transcription factor [Pseudonocardia sp. N23]GAY13141.1 regulatory protein, LuxR [Pseudonocardia sp. N23]